MPKKTTGHRIKKAREDAGMTQRDLAEQLGVESQTISRYECDRVVPEPLRFVALAKAIETTASWLHYGGR